MKKLLIIGLLFAVLMVLPVSALEPSDEYICCMDAKSATGDFDEGFLSEQCSYLQLDNERCEQEVLEWEGVEWVPDESGESREYSKYLFLPALLIILIIIFIVWYILSRRKR